MIREEKIAKIYEVIADKTLSFWCKYFHKRYNEDKTESETILCRYTTENNSLKANDKIIWHPVMIWDVLDWIEVNNISKKLFIDMPEWMTFNSPVNVIDFHWREKRKPIENQSDECIDYIFTLL